MQRYKLIGIGLILLAFIVVVATLISTILLSRNESASGTNTRPSPTVTIPPQPQATSIDTITEQVLENMHLHAWNPEAMTKNQVTGGLLINWKIDDPSVKNVTNPGADGITIHDHDPQVDLLYLTSLAEYKSLHPTDSTFDSDVSRTTALVLTDFQHYSLPKGWIYLYLLNDGLLLQRADLLSEARQIASNFYQTWYDPSVGTIYNRNHSPGDYDTNYTLEAAVSLMDAGMRWKMPDWTSAGQKTLDHTLSVAYNTHYNLFYDSMIVQNGQDQVDINQSRPSTDGEAVQALMIAYQLTHNQHYVDVATAVLHSLFDTSGLWDTARGGFYFCIKMDSGKVVTNYKETRSQGWVLIGLHSYNRVSTQPMKEQEQAVITVISQHFYQSTYHGFVYRLTPNFHFYVSKAGQGSGLEDYVTTEAMGSTMDALQETEMIMPLQGGK